jgi:hypothetical protein
MPVQNSWIVENRVLLVELIGDVTADELLDSSEAGMRLIDEVGVAPVYSLVDLARSGRYPMRLSDFMVVFRQPSSEKLSWIIICGIPNPLANFVAKTFAQMMRKQYKVFNTRAEALQMIKTLEGQPV